MFHLGEQNGVTCSGLEDFSCGYDFFFNPCRGNPNNMFLLSLLMVFLVRVCILRILSTCKDKGVCQVPDEHPV